MTELRIGILGAARIAPSALVRPARQTEGVVVAAVAARDPARAAAFAKRHRIPIVHRSYEDLVADRDIDAIYNPLPNGLHALWTVKALQAGKHVLCEKPFTANAEDAREVEAVRWEASQARGRWLIVMEAFHYRYHPLMTRVRKSISSLGRIRRVEANMCFPLPFFGDIRYRYELAGGALMDAGCYALHFLRHAVPDSGEPQVVEATAKVLTRDPRVDRAMTVELRYPDGATGRARASMWSSSLLDISARIVGDYGELRLVNFVMPQAYHHMKSIVDGTVTTARIAGSATYTHQLRAFAAAVRGDTSANLTPPEDSIATMALVDAAYTAAGLPLRV